MADYFDNSDAVLLVPANPHSVTLRDGDALDATRVPARNYLIQGELLRAVVILTPSQEDGASARLEPTSLSLFEQLQFDVFLLATAPATSAAAAATTSSSGSGANSLTSSKSASSDAAASAAANDEGDDDLPTRVQSRDFGKLMKRIKRVKQEVDPAHAFEHAARAQSNGDNVGGGGVVDDETSYVLDGAPIRLANGDIAFSLRIPINVEHACVGQKLQLVVALERKAPFAVRSAPDVFSSALTYDALMHPKYSDPPLTVLLGATKPLELLEPMALAVQAEPFDAGGDRLLYTVTARAAPHAPPHMLVEKLNVLIESTRFEARIVNDQQALVAFEPGDAFTFLVEVQPTAAYRVRRNVGMVVPPSTEEATFMLFWCADVVWRRAASFVRWRLPPPSASPVAVRVVMPDAVPRVQRAFAVEVVLTNSSDVDVGVVCELPDGTTPAAAPLVCLDKTLIYERIAPGASVSQVAHFVAVNRGLFKVGELTLRVTPLAADSSGTLGGLWLVSAESERELMTVAVE